MAQSNGPNPGASATFSRRFDAGTGALVVVGGNCSILDALGCGAPGTRRAEAGRGGGGISWVSVKILGKGGTDEGGTGLSEVVLVEDALCALFNAGKAGGISLSSSPASPVSVLSSSSSGCGGEIDRVTAGSGSNDC